MRLAAFEGIVWHSHPVEEILKCGVSVVVRIAVVVCRCGVVSCCCLPPVGHAVAVGVIAFRVSCLFDSLISSCVGFSVNKPFLPRLASGVGVGLAFRLVDDAPVVVGQHRHVCPDIRENVLQGSVCRLHRGVRREEWRIDKGLPVEHLSARCLISVCLVEFVLRLRTVYLLAYVSADVCRLCAGAGAFKLQAQEIFL